MPTNARPAIKPTSLNAVEVQLGEPVLVSMATPGEKTWGYWQFPIVSRLPGGELLLTVNNTQDDDLCYGHSGPAWLSHDEGRTWHAADLDEKLLTVAHSPVAEVFDGEFIIVPLPLGLKPGDIPPESLGEPVGSFFSYIWRRLYPLERFPKHVRKYMAHVPGLRWDPKARRWNAENFKWDMRDALMRIDDAGMVGRAMASTSLEYAPARLGRELLDANYKVAYLHEDGHSPAGFEVLCMASKDNGRSWSRRGVIARDPSGTASPSESALAVTARGDLVCVCRTTDHRQLPMWITWSKDRGRTWQRPQTLFDHGVLPNLLLLDNGVMVLSFGRPGVHVSFSPRGEGKVWTKPLEILPTGIPRRAKGKWTWEEILVSAGDSTDLQKDGYTSMVPLGPDTLLITYCDMAHVDARGRKRKAVKVRTITVRPK